MSLSITINNISDLTDKERAILRFVIGDEQVTLTGPTATQRYLESLAGNAPPIKPEEMLDGGYLMAGGDEAARQFVADVMAGATRPPIPASAELDSAGLPWDKRIHSSSRAKVADGTWRKLRGVDETLIAKVEAELRAVQAIPVPVAVTTEAVIAAPSTDSDNRREVGEVIATVPVPPAPTATVAEMQAKLAAVAPPAPLTFAELMKHVTPMLVSGKLPQDKLLAITAEFKLPHLAALGARPDLVEAVRVRIDAEVAE